MKSANMNETNKHSLKIRINEDAAAIFSKGWESANGSRVFEFVFNEPYYGQDQLQASHIVPHDENSMKRSTSPESKEEAIAKNVVLVKVSDDGTFHYELDMTDEDFELCSKESGNYEHIEKKEENNHRLDDSLTNTGHYLNVGERTEADGSMIQRVAVSDDPTDMKPALNNDSGSFESIPDIQSLTTYNRPSVIFVNNKSTSPEANEPATVPATLVFLNLNDSHVANEVEIDTCSETVMLQQEKEEVDNSPDVLQPLSQNKIEPPSDMPQKQPTQVAQVTPFTATTRASKRSLVKSRSPKTPTSADDTDIIDVIRNSVVKIGPNETQIAGEVYYSINWSSVRVATRILLTTLFPREVLATHTLTGKPSPAFRDRKMPIKKPLDGNIVNDIIYLVTRKCNVEPRTVRAIITLKCADENKLLRMRIAKQKRTQGGSKLEGNKENSQ